MKKLVIDRSKWARGGVNGDAMLLNSQGNMCCLGFACLAVGLSTHDISGHGVPEDLAYSLTVDDDPGVGRIFLSEDHEDKWRDNVHVDKAVGINDNVEITDADREELLKPVLAQLGFDVEFV